ncbi:MAG: TatD family hydrolase [Pseudarcicella sp.]|nr:TatD family hydrolase [Pseudarcicella sp.]MBP6411463.1 TatD family hydrolase [Pseudarcicella sp.]
MSLINIHTHHIEPHTNAIQVLNIDEIASFDFQVNTHKLSLGIHPNKIIEATFDADFEILTQMAKHQNVIMIGECGLDRNSAVNFELQKKVFTAHLKLAELLKKPVIIHCVRAFDELMSIKKKNNPQVPLIIHGYNNNQQIAQALVKQGFYLSLGTQLLNPSSNPAKNIKTIPLNRLFLETDDKNHTISSIFAVASSILNLQQTLLVDVIRENYEKIFYATNSL